MVDDSDIPDVCDWPTTDCAFKVRHDQELATSQYNLTLAVAAGQEWKKNYDHAEAERIYYKEESERFQKESLGHFNQLQKVGRELSLDRDLWKSRCVSGNGKILATGKIAVQLRTALKMAQEAIHSEFCSTGHHTQCLSLDPALAIVPTQAEKIVAAYVQMENALMGLGYDHFTAAMNDAVETLAAARKGE